MKTSDTTLMTTEDAIIHQEVELMTKKFNGAVDFLKKTKVSVKETHRSLFNARWFLVIGAPKAGKSALLAHSGLNFVLTKKSVKTEKKIAPTRFCDWWVTREAVFLDTAGSFTLHRGNNSTERHLWFHFLDLLAEQKREPIHGIIVTVSIERLMLQSKEEQDTHFQQIQARLAEVHQRLSLTVPIYIIFTKADYLAGFCEFFDELTPEDKEQTWGMSFNHLDVLDSQKIADNFDTEFNMLLQKLNDKLITRLHQEHDWQKRAKIKDFPLQLESCKNTIAAFLQKISDSVTADQQSVLRGIYLTSAVPEGNVVDRLLKPLSQGFSLTPFETKNVPEPYGMQHSPFFIKAVFQNIIFPDSEYFAKQLLLQHQEKKAWVQRSAIYASLLVLISGVILWTHHFSQSMDQLDVVENAISEYRALIQSPDSLKAEQALSTLNTLADAKTTVLEAKFPWLMQFSAKQKKLKEEQQTLYAKALRIIVQTQLENVLKNELSVKGPLDANAIYGTLKAYLMLEDPQHFDKQYVEDQVTTYWSLVLPQTKINSPEIHEHFAPLDQKDFQGIQLNDDLIQEAREQLTQLGTPKLLEAVISNDYFHDDAPLNLSLVDASNRFSFENRQKTQNIPARYTKDYFPKIYETMIPEAAEVLAKGNWVLGSDKGVIPNKDDIITAARAQYMKDYIDAWQNLLNGIHVASPTSYSDAIATIDDLTQDNSSFNKLLKTVSENTNILYDNMPTPISDAFNPLNNSLQAKNTQTLLLQPLDELKSYLDSINNSSNVPQAAFNFAKQRMEVRSKNDVITQLVNVDTSIPAPFNGWAKQLATQSWELILSDTNRYINTVWQNEVLPDFSTKISNRFPFSKSAQEEVSLQDFNGFFAPNGTISNFFVNYVSPFVDTQTAQWSSAVLNDQHITFSDEALKKLQQAALLQNVFYPNGQSTPEVALFLQPTRLSPEVQNLIVTVDKQATVFSQDQYPHLPLRWPSITGTQDISITLIGKNGVQTDTRVSGLWSWLKLIEKGQLEPTRNPQEVLFALNEQGFTGEYRLESNSPLNPFNPEIFNDFNLPKEL